MGLSVREIRLIEALLRHPAGLTADGLADRLNVSARTVRRDVPAATHFLAAYDLALTTQSGRGIRVEGTDTARGEALADLGEMASPELPPDERRRYLLRALLQTGEPIKLRALASRLKVAVGTVSRDLDWVEDWLANSRLSLVRRRGYGVEVTGTEADLRLAMGRLILQNLQGTGEYSSGTLSERLLGMIDEERLRTVERLTGEALERLPYAIADSAFVNLSVHVALMVERLLQGGGIEMNANVLERFREMVEYETARGLAEAIEEAFPVEVPEEEVAYITMHLRGTKLRGDELDRYFEKADLEVASRVSALIHYVEQQTGVVLGGDSSLYTGLLAHVERAIHRVREHMSIYNPLLADIKEDYPALFDLVEGGMEKVFVDEEIPEEEVGFVAMHFGAALDRGQGGFPNRVLVICDSGIASSRMLASRLEKAFPQIRHLRNASLFDLQNLDPREFDLVVSTVPLPLPASGYVQVRPLLSADEEERIRDHLRELRAKTRLADRAVSESLEVLGGGQTRFRQMAEATQTIAELMEDFFLRAHEARGSVPEAVRLMCASLAEERVTSEPERLERALLSRLDLGGIGIPDTTIALFHARDASVLRPSFSAHDFEAPLEIEGMDGATMPVHRSMLMVAPQELSPTALEAISEISVAMVGRPEDLEVFQRGTEKQVTDVLQNVFARYLQNKLT